MQGVVLVLAAQHLNGTVQLIFTTDEGIMVSQVVIDTQHIVAPRTSGLTGIGVLLVDVFFLYIF